MKRLRILALLLAGAPVLLILLLLVIVAWPSIIVNPRVMGWGMKTFSKPVMNAHVRWGTLETETDSVSFFEKRIEIRFGDFCMTLNGGAARSCFGKAYLALAYDFRSFPPRITELGPVQLLDGQASINLDSPLRSRTAKPARRSGLRLPDFVAHAELKDLLVKVDRFYVDSAQKDFSGAFRLNYRDGMLVLMTDAKVSDSRGIELADLVTDLSARNRTRELAGPWDISGDLGLELHRKGKLTVGVTAGHDDQKEFRYEVRAKYTSENLVSTAQTSGFIRADRIEGSLDQNVRSTARKSRLASLRIRNCRYSYFESDRNRRAGKARVNCPAFAEVGRLRSRKWSTLFTAVTSKKRIGATIQADLELPFPFDAASPIDAVVKIVPGPALSEKVARVSGGVNASVTVIPSGNPVLRHFDAKIDLSARIPEFGLLVKELSGTVLVIPAPLQALRGKAAMNLTGDLNLTGGRLAIAVQSALASPKRTQRLFVEGHGGVEISATRVAPGRRSRPIAVSATADLKLLDMRLSLPRLSPGPPPQLLPDQRLTGSSIAKALRTASPQQRTIELSYSIRVRTPRNSYLRVASNFTPTPVPIRLNLLFQDPGELKGWVQVRHFPLNFLGGKKEIGNVNIALDTRKERGLLVGRIQVVAGDVKTVIPPTQAAGQAAGQAAPSRAAPQFSVPLMRIASSILFGIPLDEVAVQPSLTTRPPEIRNRETSAFVHVKTRY